MNLTTKIGLFTLLLIGSYLCSAQEISIRGGFNLSKCTVIQDNRNIEGMKFNPGLQIGSIIELPLKNQFTAETGILFTSKGSKKEYPDSNGQYNFVFTRTIYYTEVPFLIKATFPLKENKIFGMIGPYVACALFGYDITKGDVSNTDLGQKSYLKWGNDAEYKLDRLDYGIKIGGGIKIKTTQFGIIYGLGLKNYSNYSLIKQRNKGFEFYIAYKIKSLRKSAKTDNRVM